MTVPTHILVGMVIGKVTGNYPAALIGATGLDIDHFISHIKHKRNLKQIWAATVDVKDPYSDQRGILHSLFSLIIISAIVVAMNPKVGLIFGLAYLSHLILDALDSADFFPFYPWKKFKIVGPVNYFFSKTELIFMAALIVLYFAIPTK